MTVEEIELCSQLKACSFIFQSKILWKPWKLFHYFKANHNSQSINNFRLHKKSSCCLWLAFDVNLELVFQSQKSGDREVHEFMIFQFSFSQHIGWSCHVGCHATGKQWNCNLASQPVMGLKCRKQIICKAIKLCRRWKILMFNLQFHGKWMTMESRRKTTKGQQTKD